MKEHHSLVFIVAAVVCFVVALLLALSVFSGGNETAWTVGGLLALTLSFLP
jgi:hypothetical protein